LDVRFGDVAILLDIPVERSIADAPTEDGELSVGMLQRCLYTHKTGVTILPAPVRPAEWRSVGAAHVQQAVALLAQTHDYVILDSPKSYRIVSAALEPADSLFLVTTEAESSLESTNLDLRMLRWWGFPQDKIKLITNATNEVTNMEPQNFEQALGREVFASVPYDRNISTATQLGTALVVSHPESRAAQSILGLGERVTRGRWRTVNSVKQYD
jgi:pilus assembly protein CpaE